MPTESERKTPGEIESSAISFTEEAETALKRFISRFERQVRGHALEEAVRRRGLPAEVTGSDVQRAFNHLMWRHVPPRDRSLAIHSPESFFQERFGSPDTETRERDRPRHFYQRLASAYIWLGALAFLGGVIWAPASHFAARFAGDPAWRTGFYIALSGLVVALLGIVVRFSFDRLLNTRDRGRTGSR